VFEAQATARALDGFDVRFNTTSANKETRAKPVSAQCEAGNVKIVRGLWNDEFLRSLENFPAAKHDDETDALSGAYGVIGGPRGGPVEFESVHIPGVFRFGNLDGLCAKRDHWKPRGMQY
jgi:hypothetical protein